MRTKRYVIMATLVALLSGGLAMAADNNSPPSNDEQTLDSGGTNVLERTGFSRVARYRAIWGQRPNPLPEQEPQQLSRCTDSPLVRMLADLLGYQDVVRTCNDRNE